MEWDKLITDCRLGLEDRYVQDGEIGRAHV